MSGLGGLATVHDTHTMQSLPPSIKDQRLTLGIEFDYTLGEFASKSVDRKYIRTISGSKATYKSPVRRYWQTLTVS